MAAGRSGSWGRVLGGIAVVAAACAAPYVAAPPPPAATDAPPAARIVPPKLLARARFVAVGDVLPHGNVKNAAEAAAGGGAAEDGWVALLGGVADHIGDADLAFANLETPVAPGAGRGTRAFVFNAPVAMLDGLRAVGFDVLSFANNHVYDQGRAGFVETLDTVAAAGFVQVGAGATRDAAHAARTLDVGGFKVAFLGATDLLNSDLNGSPDAPSVARLDVPRILAEVASARADGADLVVLSVHWGVEYAPLPRQRDLDAAHALIDGGVDVLLGHHPHVPQPLELREAPDGRLGLIAYSLGNFVSNQAWWYDAAVHAPARGRPRDGLMLAFDLVRKSYGRGPSGAELIVTSLANVHVVPLWTDNDATRVAEPAPTLRVVDIDRALAEAAGALEAAETDAAALAAHRRLELLRLRRAEILDVVGPAFLAE